MYVAITRAKEKLYLLNAGRRMLYGNMQMNPPSRFISEISDNMIAILNDALSIVKITNISKKIHIFLFLFFLI